MFNLFKAPTFSQSHEENTQEFSLLHTAVVKFANNHFINPKKDKSDITEAPYEFALAAALEERLNQTPNTKLILNAFEKFCNNITTARVKHDSYTRILEQQIDIVVKGKTYNATTQESRNLAKTYPQLLVDFLILRFAIIEELTASIPTPPCSPSYTKKLIQNRQLSIEIISAVREIIRKKQEVLGNKERLLSNEQIDIKNKLNELNKFNKIFWNHQSKLESTKSMRDYSSSSSSQPAPLNFNIKTLEINKKQESAIVFFACQLVSLYDKIYSIDQFGVSHQKDPSALKPSMITVYSYKFALTLYRRDMLLYSPAVVTTLYDCVLVQLLISSFSKDIANYYKPDFFIGSKRSLLDMFEKIVSNLNPDETLSLLKLNIEILFEEIRDTITLREIKSVRPLQESPSAIFLRDVGSLERKIAILLYPQYKDAINTFHQEEQKAILLSSNPGAASGALFVKKIASNLPINLLPTAHPHPYLKQY